MAILENTTDYAAGDQVTPTNLNALTESAKFVKSTGAVASTGNTTDETTLDIDSSGQIYIKSLGVDTAQVAAAAVENAKLDPTTGGAAVAGSGATGSHVNVIQYESVDTNDLTADCITPAKIEDAAVQSEHFANEVISGQTELTAPPADADEILLSDGGLIKKVGIDRLFDHHGGVKCYGQVTMSTGTVTGGFNVSSTATGTTTARVVTMSKEMAGTDYTVQLTIEGTAASWSAASVEPTTSTTFTVYKSSGSGPIHFTVFGELAAY